MPFESRICKSVDTREPTYDTTRHGRSFRTGQSVVENRSFRPSDLDHYAEDEEFSGVPIEDLVGEEFDPSSRRIGGTIQDLVGDEYDPSIRRLSTPAQKSVPQRKIRLSSIGITLPKLSLRKPKQPNQAELRKTYASSITSVHSAPKASLSDRLKSVREEQAKLEQKVFELKQRYRGLQADEASAKGNIQRLIQISFEKRRIKLSLQAVGNQTAGLKHKEKHIQTLLDRNKARNDILDILGVSQSRASEILRKSWKEPAAPRKNYYDKQLDRRELSAIKQGMPLRDALSDLGCERRINFGIQERVFLKDRIISAHKDRVISSDAKKKEALTKQSQNLEQIRQGIFQRKILRNKGIFGTNGERSLYPQRLTDSSMQPFLELRKLESDTDRSKYKLDRFLSKVRPRSPIDRVSDDRNSTFLTLGNLSLLD